MRRIDDPRRPDGVRHPCHLIAVSDLSTALDGVVESCEGTPITRADRKPPHAHAALSGLASGESIKPTEVINCARGEHVNRGAVRGEVRRQ